MSSRESSDKPVQYRRPRADVFTVLLLIALMALGVGIAALWALMADYKYEFKGGPPVSMRSGYSAGMSNDESQMTKEYRSPNAEGPFVL